MVVRGFVASAAFAAAKATGRTEDVLAVAGEGPSCPQCKAREFVFRSDRAVGDKRWLCERCNLIFEGSAQEWEHFRAKERERGAGAPRAAQETFAVATEQLAKKVEDEEGDAERDDGL